MREGGSEGGRGREREGGREEINSNTSESSRKETVSKENYKVTLQHSPKNTLKVQYVIPKGKTRKALPTEAAQLTGLNHSHRAR